ncbi:hypothetical protein [Formosa algae]|uniref:Transcriptional regulator n=1 Tax=Formosa algae TaxID=225843 RepID=A0A9X0YNF8_9FLAO|nr:hypothetical protein [Formosa algae]MBP1841138.1 putative transcriptional regulator [Formosa algae]MDQ0336442.1 putative transcriptional regulator [Formosa algae]OEI81405.1 hypothetical protein AST99_03990 [Formosa algae]
MSKVAECPTCGGKCKIKETHGKVSYQALQDDELIKKVGQLKNAMQKIQEKAETLEKELEALKSTM